MNLENIYYSIQVRYSNMQKKKRFIHKMKMFTGMIMISKNYIKYIFNI